MANNSSQTKGYAKLLHDAVRQRGVQRVRKLVRKYKRPNKRFGGCPPLAIAINNKSHDVIKVLLEHGADVTLKDETTGRSPLGEAVRHGNQILVETLLGHCGSLGGYADEPLLCDALERQSEETVLMLIEHGAHVGKRNDGGSSPLILACREARHRVVQKLIDMGADVNDQEPDGSSPLMKASSSADLATAKMLIDAGAKLDLSDQPYSPLWMAVTQGDLQMAKFLVHQGANVNWSSAKGSRPLSVAVKGGMLEIARFLLANGADANRPVDAGLGPLFLAARHGDLVMARLLLDNGAQVNAASASDGYTPLMLAARNGHAQMVSYLIRKGADVGTKAANGRTALSMTASAFDAALLTGDKAARVCPACQLPTDTERDRLRQPATAYQYESIMTELLANKSSLALMC